MRRNGDNDHAPSAARGSGSGSGRGAPHRSERAGAARAGADPLWDRDAADLLRTLLGLRTAAEAKRFLRDLMTEDEIHMVVDRWRVARMLARGKRYKEIEETTGLSSRTIARISRWLKEGEGGYRLMLARKLAKRSTR